MDSENGNGEKSGNRFREMSLAKFIFSIGTSEISKRLPWFGGDVRSCVAESGTLHLQLYVWIDGPEPRQ